MSGSVVPLGRRGASVWRLRRWPNDPSTAMMVLVDSHAVPSLDDFARAAADARALGAGRIRTSAMFPVAADVAARAGFDVIDTLALLRRPLGRDVDDLPQPSTRAMRTWHVQRAAALDERAFGNVWGNDVDGIAEIRRATPVHRARIIVAGRRIAGFAISGAGGDGGYLQRLAVDPSMQRRGVGRALVLDALHWLRRRPIDTAYVNTAVANVPALALYESLGFVRIADHLTIAELVLPT